MKDPLDILWITAEQAAQKRASGEIITLTHPRYKRRRVSGRFLLLAVRLEDDAEIERIKAMTPEQRGAALTRGMLFEAS